MCQRNNRYDQTDAARTHAYKVLAKPFGRARCFRSIFQLKRYPVGKVVRAVGSSPRFVDRDEIGGGAIHVFTNLDDAREHAFDRFSPAVVVRVAVDGYVASGNDGDNFRTACYARVVVEDVVDSL